MGYLNEDGLARYDGLLKNWVTLKSGTVDGVDPLLNWQRTDTAGAVTFYPLPAAPIDPVVNFAFTESGPASGTKGPDNPSTITGVSEVKVTRCGKNIIKYPYQYGSRTISGVTFIVDSDGSILVNGTATALIAFWLSSSGILIPSHCTTALSGCPAGGSYSSYGILFTTLSGSSSSSSDYGSGGSVVTGDSICVIRPYLRIASGITVSNLVFRPQLELGSTATAFEPYAGSDYTINLNGTYYGGSVDLSAGTMTVTWAGDVVTGTEGYVQGVTSDAIFSYESNARIITNRPFSNCICERFTNGTDLNCFRAFNSGRIRFYVDAVAYPSVESFSSWLASLYASGTPLIMVYQVATPYTVQLTPTQIYSLSQLDPYTPRLNTVYSDQTSVQVGYPKSPQATATELTNAIISLGGNV